MSDTITLDADTGDALRVIASPPRADESERPIDPRLVLLAAPDSPAAAGYRVLRHRVLSQDDPRVIAVTSAGPHEGKSACAANLALAIAEGGQSRVLLVEANLRAPSLATLFAVTPGECFARQMAAHRPTDGARRERPWSVAEISPGLHLAALLPPAEGEPLHLDGPALAAALTSLRAGGYDYLVVDAPAVLGSADVNLIDQCVDGVLFTVLRGRTSGRALGRAIEQLRPKKLLGLVLVGA